MFLPGFKKTASRESVFALIGWDTPVTASQAARLISFTPSFSRRRKRSRNVPQFRYRSECRVVQIEDRTTGSSKEFCRLRTLPGHGNRNVSRLSLFASSPKIPQKMMPTV